MGRAPRSTGRKPFFDSLEERAVPTTFGVPWQDARRISLSFAPDGTSIAGHVSNLFEIMNGQQPAPQWQKAILAAFQTWAVQANINIGLTSDSGDPFGAPGLAQHDARFGDIRLGAQEMSPDALSISVPNGSAPAATLSGDVLINNGDRFGASALDLYSVILHEAGHVFGIDDGTDPNSPMNSTYTGATRLTSADIKAIQSLYGTRALDPNEGSSGNGSFGTATQMAYPGGYTGKTPLVVFGDIGSSKDIDLFAVKPPGGYSGPVTIRLQSSGISLLTTHLTVFDAKGNPLGDAQAASDFGDTVRIRLPQVVGGATYYLKVQGTTQDLFGIGSYGLAVTFDSLLTVSDARIDGVLRGPYEGLSVNDLNVLFLSPSQTLVNDIHLGDGGTLVTRLTASSGFAKNTHYETVGSLSTPRDVTDYQIQSANAPSGSILVLTVSLRRLDPNGTVPRVRIIDGDGKEVPAEILAATSGTYTIQTAGLKGGGNYLLRVSSDPNAAPGTGNYALTADFRTNSAVSRTFAAGSLDAATPSRSYDLYVGEAQLMRTLLVAGQTAAAGETVRMTITDKNGVVIGALQAAAGTSAGGDAVFLTPGAYRVTFSIVGAPASGATPIMYALKGDTISDPIGPVLSDPTMTPEYTSPTLPGYFVYPTGIVTIDPYLFLIVPALLPSG